ncbi:cytochrome c oxidase subunit 4 [Saprospiraceae bacterium]|nr:cytochrome c oxidase subunit 4 [Saprospiraceae bacterium]
MRKDQIQNKFPKEGPFHPSTPQELPPPTYYPFFVAMAVTFIFWGLVTSYWISAIGLLLFAIGLRGWIADLLNEKSEHEE